MSGQEGFDELGQIKEIIKEETIYLRHHIGEIVDIKDPNNQGRVKVALSELGWNTPDLALWCWPRQGNSMTIPKLGKYAEVYFINGDRTRPVYLFPASEIVNNIPKSYIGDTKIHIIFESPEQQLDNIKFEAQQQLLTLLSGTEAVVLGDKLLTWITNYIDNLYNLHTHPYVDTPVGASVTSPPSPAFLGSSPTDILSQNIKVK